jgi:hypothetical protein
LVNFYQTTRHYNQEEANFVLTTVRTSNPADLLLSFLVKIHVSESYVHTGKSLFYEILLGIFPCIVSFLIIVPYIRTKILYNTMMTFIHVDEPCL